MATIKHLFDHIGRYRSRHRALYVLCGMIVFWAIFDGIISYITPLLIVQHGISKTELGLIIGSSSLAGAFFDLLMCWIFKNAKHRRILTIMFAICLIYPLILHQATTATLFFVAMVVWGFYYDLHNIANFEYVGNHLPKAEHSSAFGLIYMASSFGYLMAPILAGLVIVTLVDWKAFIVAWILLFISICFFLALNFVGKKEIQDDMEIRERVRPINLLLSVSLWHRIVKIIAPILVLTCLLNIIDSFFWTIGPIVAEGMSQYHQFAGFFMVAFTLPPLLVGWGIGKITTKYGKKQTAFVSLLIGSLILSTMMFWHNPFILIAIVLLFSSSIAFSWPAINGVYADFISETDNLTREIESVEDFFVNIGYIVGPILAGFLADRAGNMTAFSILGVFGAIMAFVLMKITPKSIRIDQATEISSHFDVINNME